MRQATANDIFKFLRLRSVGGGEDDKSAGSYSPDYYVSTDFSERVRATPELDRRLEAATQFLASDSRAIRRLDQLGAGSRLVVAFQKALRDGHATVADYVALAGRELETAQASREVRTFVERLSDTALALEITAPNTTKLDEMKVAYMAFRLSEAAAAAAPNDLAHNALLSLRLRHLAAGWPGAVVPTVGARVPWGRKSALKAVGVADLMVVKQHILRYEATEVAHIENVMAKETRGRTHRFLERVEETITLEREMTDTREQELETSTRFELNKESSLTIKEDQRFGFDLSVSAKYGPMVEVRSQFGFESNESREASHKSSSNYAKNVVDRSLQRVQKRVREERIHKMIRETEETNRHEFANSMDEHVVGIYQFVDKVYQAQVFNYGKRQMFDLFVPDPASLIWHFERHPLPESTAVQIPAAPIPFTATPAQISMDPPSAREVLDGKVFYADLVARYGATGVQAPPDAKAMVMDSRSYPAPVDGGPGAGAAGDAGAPRFVDLLKLKIPASYRPTRAVFSATASSDAPDAINIYFTLDEAKRWVGSQFPASAPIGAAHPNIRAGTIAVELPEQHAYAAADEGVLAASVLIWDASQWTVTVSVTCELTEAAVRSWQASVFDAVRTAYNERVKEWQDEVERVKAAVAAKTAETAPVGVPPDVRANTILTELKKHCISIFTDYWYDDPSVMVAHGTSPPSFGLDRAEDFGNAVRFFEQAFEWHQMQYAFYPYYWSPKATWQEKLMRSDPDYRYQEFLRAGGARVLIPVRPGFEYAVNVYLEHHQIWSGAGVPPPLHDRAYLSIVDEIKEQSGEELDVPIPVGEPWEVRVPTSLIYLKAGAELPCWRKVADEPWAWQPLTGGD